jgi:hypothetical protein
MVHRAVETYLGIQEIDDWDEGRIEHSPDDVELPVERINTNWRNFHNFLTLFSDLGTGEQITYP